MVYLLASLPPELAHAGAPTALVAAVPEDRELCDAQGSLPRVIATFANLAISVLPLPGKRNLARALDDFRLDANSAVAVVRSAAGTRMPRGGVGLGCASSQKSVRRAGPSGARTSLSGPGPVRSGVSARDAGRKTLYQAQPTPLDPK